MIREYPVSEVKIDKSFINRVELRTEDEVVVGAMIPDDVIGTIFLNSLQGAVVRYASKLASGTYSVDWQKLTLLKASSSVCGITVALQIKSNLQL